MATRDQEPEAHLLVDLQRRLAELRVYELRELDLFCRSLRQPGRQRSQHDPELSRQLVPALTRFAELYPGPQEELRDKLSQYIQLYPSLSQTLPSQDHTLERLFIFGRFLLRQLPIGAPKETFEVAEGVLPTPYQHNPRESRGVQAPGPGSEAREGELVRQIRQELPAELVSRFQELTAVRQAEALTLEEHEELLRLTERLEGLHLKRMQHLGELAALRHTSLRAVTDDLGIHPLRHARRLLAAMGEHPSSHPM